MTSFSAIVIGDESLLITCSDLLLEKGHHIRAVVTRDADIAKWANTRGLHVVADPTDLNQSHESTWLFSIANLRMLPASTLALGQAGAINFHDGPLPAYAGLNAPVWGLLNGEDRFGVTWHLMASGPDRGDILAQKHIEISPDETAFSLNAKCYAAGFESFETLVGDIEADTLTRAAQDFSNRSYFGRNQKPKRAGRLQFDIPARDVERTVRALDFAGYWNPLTTAKLAVRDTVLTVKKARAIDDLTGAPGTVLDVDADGVTVACSEGAIRLTSLITSTGDPAPLVECVQQGEVLPSFNLQEDAALNHAMESIAPHDLFWRKRLSAMRPARLALAKRSNLAPNWNELPVDAGTHAMAAAVLWAGVSCDRDQGADLAVSTQTTQAAWKTAPDFVSVWVPLALPDCATKSDLISAVKGEMDTIVARSSFAQDLLLRDPHLSAVAPPQIAVAHGTAPLEGTVITMTPDTGTLHFDSRRIDPEYVEVLAARLSTIAEWLTGAADADRLSDCPRLSKSEKEQLNAWNATAVSYDVTDTIPDAFARQVASTPDATAIVFENTSVTYAALERRVDAIAEHLLAIGAKPRTHIGLHCRRSIDMVAAALAIMKVGAAYVPLDPAYPKDRIAHYITDSQAPIIVTQSDIATDLPGHTAALLDLNDVHAAAAPVASSASAETTAYLIYTSGSTGAPKGVLVSHRNVMNFFKGMDAEIDVQDGMTWAAVTSMAFDISVLELFYTLARGFKLVLIGDENRAAVSNGPIRLPGKKIDFNLFYWGNDDGVGRDKYKLLLEGAQFADAHGFNAVWTPERHFHAFGGPYPNPSVTGAAVAAVTRNLSVRAGSCVAPLHHTARIAEEWAVIDNLTNGRAGLAIASGWQPDDFVLRPENTPPENKPAMYRAIKDLRALWRGETVAFDKADGTAHAVLTQPRPVSKDLPVWVTTAGNPDTWREAGEIGANVLTHLLGQSIEEVREKITIYHKALRDAGHDPDDFTVTLMLHTYIDSDRDTARQVARGPMKDYLRSAAGLIKQYAWAFPAFKRPQGVTTPFEMDLGSLSDDELDAILDFAFERYFEESGLFGTIEDARARVEDIKRIGVTEIACLIDYGIPVAQVLDGLRPLAQVLKAANAPAELDADDMSLAAQLIRHNVSHLQCTPSMARIIAMNDEARLALSVVKHLLIGGEALPANLVRDLRRATPARVTNMYGPTETTIWSSTQRVPDDCTGTVPIGLPIANTTLHVLDEDGRQTPVGVPGELCIGGDGVTPGYWKRPELTSDRFVMHDSARVYRTGDLVCLRADGIPEFLGRNDNQVKIRGQRIELGEIETALNNIKQISQAIVNERTSENGDTTLNAYFTASSTVDLSALRLHLSETLPQTMIPSTFTELDAFPLTPNRKVDRNALPDPRSDAPRDDDVQLPSSSFDQGSMQDRIAGIWRRILGVDDIAADDNFFALGGHSLLAVQAHRDIKTALEKPDLSITDIFRFPTLRALSDHIVGSETASQTPSPAADIRDRDNLVSKRKAMRANRRARVG